VEAAVSGTAMRMALLHLQCDGVEAQWRQPQAGCMSPAGLCSKFHLLFCERVKWVVTWKGGRQKWAESL
jgi:hypothetical protein